MGKGHIPGVRSAGWIRKKWMVELAGSVPPLVIAAIAAYRLFADPTTRDLGYYAAAAAAWLVLASIIKIVHAAVQDKDNDAARDHDGLRAALWVLRAAAGRSCKLAPDNSKDALRVTFHRVVPPLDNPQEIEQIVPYIGGEGGSGRKFKIGSGITGKCIRTKDVLTMHRTQDDVMSYRKDLAADWGYTDKEAAMLSADRFSMMAVPVMNASGNHALGVIYLDGKQKDLFASDDVQGAIIEACAGVTSYVSERY